MPSHEEMFERSRQIRDRLLAQEDWLASEQVADRTREQPEVLRRARRLLGVCYKGNYLHPAFQFLPTGDVSPVMARVLHVLPITDSDWNAVFWFFSPSGLLAGRRPADVFRENPESVVAAAESYFVRRDDEF